MKKNLYKFDPKKTILIGKNGNLGSAFIESFPALMNNAVGKECISRIDKCVIEELLSVDGIELVINCAAHTNAEQGEIDREVSYLTNTMLPGLLSQVCFEMGIKLVHFSSTGVYGNYKQTPYTEFDTPKPTTVHHDSKLKGEEEILKASPNALVLRTGWLFGGSPDKRKSFVWDRIQESINNKKLGSDISQFGNPTWVKDVVNQTITAIEHKCCGIFNCVSLPTARRFDYVKEILTIIQSKCRLEEVDGKHFNRIAPVSWTEMAVNYKFDLLRLNEMPDWRDSLRIYIKELSKTMSENNYE